MPFQKVRPDWKPVAALAPPFSIVLVLFSTFSNSYRAAFLSLPMLPHLLVGLEEGDPPFPGPSFLPSFRDSGFLFCWLPHYEDKRKSQTVSLIQEQCDLMHVSSIPEPPRCSKTPSSKATLNPSTRNPKSPSWYCDLSPLLTICS